MSEYDYVTFKDQKKKIQSQITLETQDPGGIPLMERKTLKRKKRLIKGLRTENRMNFNRNYV